MIKYISMRGAARRERESGEFRFVYFQLFRETGKKRSLRLKLTALT